jgi:hypothetical protein
LETHFGLNREHQGTKVLGIYMVKEAQCSDSIIGVQLQGSSDLLG